MSLDLPRHRWEHHFGTAPDGVVYPEVSFWYCPDCNGTQLAPPDQPPETTLCMGKGPHTAEDIALLGVACRVFGWELPERLREG